jgi:hypothetical protein
MNANYIIDAIDDILTKEQESVNSINYLEYIKEQLISSAKIVIHANNDKFINSQEFTIPSAMPLYFELNYDNVAVEPLYVLCYRPEEEGNFDDYCISLFDVTDKGIAISQVLIYVRKEPKSYAMTLFDTVEQKMIGKEDVDKKSMSYFFTITDSVMAVARLLESDFEGYEYLPTEEANKHRFEEERLPFFKAILVKDITLV